MIALIADDHPLFRVALSQACANILGNDALLLQAHNMQQVWPLLRQHPDTHFIFLDLRMPGSDRFTGLSALRTEYPDVPVIMVSAEEDPVIIKQALTLGAAAYIPKSAPLEQLSLAITAVLNGDSWLPAGLEQDVQNAKALIDDDFARQLRAIG